MAKIPFKVSARAGKLLGRENFSNPEGAIIELIKNSYDADAKNCFVFFDIPTKKVKDSGGKEIEVPIKEDSIIYIIDNGEGMTEEVILNHWMQIGTGNKEKDFISDEERVKTGAKGIGRFALDRLGFSTEMWTISKKSKTGTGFKWKMDWNQFDNEEKSISEIEAELTPDSSKLKGLIDSIGVANKDFNNLISKVDFGRGTIIKITKLKDEWYKEGISEVFKGLEALIPPKELSISFEVFFNHLQKSEMYGNVETAFFNDYDYKVKASYNSNKLTIDFEITRNELDYKTVKEKYTNLFKEARKNYNLKSLKEKTFKYTKRIDNILKWKLNDSNKNLLIDVGSFDLTFYYLKVHNSKKEGYPYKKVNAAERRSIMNRFRGVKVYRDSFRVRPYGDLTNDWLKLGARAASSPAGAGQRIGDWRVRPEQTAGIITISRKSNPLLVDKSDRGALQENDAFDTFKKIIIGVIHEFEIDRTKILNPFFLHFKTKKGQAREKEIQERAEKLAEKMVQNRKAAEEKVYGTPKLDLFQQKRDEEEKKNYKESFEETIREIDEKYSQEENEEIVQVRALASLGLIVSSFGHELKEIKNNSTEIESLEEIYKDLVPEGIKNLKTDDDKLCYQDGIDIIDLLKGNSEKIRHWVDYSLTTIGKDKRKRGKFVFFDFFKNLKKTWSRIFQSRDIQFEIIDEISNKNYDFRAFEMDMSTIFTNLVNNSIDSFNSLTKIQERIITITSKLNDLTIEIFYTDNGGGIDSVFEDKEEIFLPFTTSKKDRQGNAIGTGLGMYLVKSVIEDNGGNINILEPKTGFALKISFPIRKN